MKLKIHNETHTLPYSCKYLEFGKHRATKATERSFLFQYKTVRLFDENLTHTQFRLTYENIRLSVRTQT